MKKFDECRLRLQLERLEPKRRVLFAAIIAARLAPVYRLYCKRRQMGDLVRHEVALSFLWEQLSKSDPDMASAQYHLSQIMELMPEEDDNWGELSAQADDSLSALVYGLRCLAHPKAEEAAWAARRAYEMVDNLVMQKQGTKVGGANEVVIMAAPLIQSELLQQESDLVTATTSRDDPQALKGVLSSCLVWGEAFASSL